MATTEHLLPYNLVADLRYLLRGVLPTTKTQAPSSIIIQNVPQAPIGTRGPVVMSQIRLVVNNAQVVPQGTN